MATALGLAGFSLASMASPAIVEEAEQQRRLQSAWSWGGAMAVASGHLANPASPSQKQRAGASRSDLDRDVWRTDEFNASGGLGAINADAAYARGLTGKGIRLGVMDGGIDLSHPAFAGKDHLGLRLGDLLADGSRCAAMHPSIGPGACAFAEGDQVALELTAFADDVPDSIRNQYEKRNELQAHGVHVAGIIAANRDGTDMHGVAFGSDLVVARFAPDEITYVDMQDGRSRSRQSPRELKHQGLPELYSQLAQQHVRAVNQSWAFPTDLAETEADMDAMLAEPEYQPMLDILASGSTATGLIQVWAAGNHQETDSRPDASPVAEIFASVPRVRPEAEPYWLSVVNANSNNQLQESMRCGNTAQWCLAAPGTDILSAVVNEEAGSEYTLESGADGRMGVVIKRRLEHAYRSESGTSMAAPHVTGALGLLFERFPYLDNAQVRDVLLTTATDLGEPGVDPVYGWGLMNLEKAIEGYGQLRVDTDVVMNVRAGGLKVWEGDAWDDWTNDIGGPGALTKSGAGWLRLSGNNTFNGALLQEGILELDGVNALARKVVVEGGQLRLNGVLSATDLELRGGSALVSAGAELRNSALTVDNASIAFHGLQSGGSTSVGINGLLQGTGTLGDTRVAGTIAPGDGIGILTINGDYVQTASGRYLAGLAPGERSDLLRVSGTATLGGTLQALPEPGRYYLGEHFRIVQADGGVEGRFATADFSAFSPFLQFGLGYGANQVSIDVIRGQLLASAAATVNQRAVAGSADMLPVDQGLPRPLTMLFPQQVGEALDGLSGELHAATPMALTEGSRYVRDAALRRAVAAYAPHADASKRTGVWVQAIGGSNRLDGTANSALTRSNTHGLLVGIDHDAGGWQFGALLGNGRTDTRQAQGRAAKARSNNTHAGLYAGHQWGGFGLRGGAAYSRHHLDTHRQVDFAGYTDGLTARYRATTTQAFIEAGYRLGTANAGLEPYLQVANVRVGMDDIRERGGAAALRGEASDTSTTVTTAGIRLNKGLKVSFQQEAWLNVVGGLGYRRTTGDREGQAMLAFDGGNAFAVTGAPMADRAVVAELGLSAWLSPAHQLELGYSGQFGKDSRDHGINARWSMRF
ncbi:serine protease [Stenotrophomonas maltophilia]|nr:serine protease [Stenotrophomonas maltophilia]